MTFSYADNHLDDLHRLMPGKKNDDDTTKRRFVMKNPHLVDWYFSFRLEEFFKAFLDNALNCDWRWHRQAITILYFFQHSFIIIISDTNTNRVVQYTHMGFLN